MVERVALFVGVVEIPLADRQVFHVPRIRCGTWSRWRIQPVADDVFAWCSVRGLVVGQFAETSTIGTETVGWNSDGAYLASGIA